MKKLRNFEVPYRGGTSSHRFNEAMGQVSDDISQAYETLRVHSVRLYELARVTNYSNQALRSRIKDVEFLLYLAGFFDTSYKIMSASMYNPAAVVAGNSEHSSIYGEITLPFSSVHDKIPRFFDFRDRSRPTPQVSVEVSVDGGAYVAQERDTGAYHPLDRYGGDAWVYESPTEVTSVDYKVTYPTPVSPTVNLVTVEPVPEGFVKIDDLQYLNAQGSYVTIPGFEEDVTGSWRFHFTDTDVSNSFNIKMVPPGDAIAFTNLDGDARYAFGLKSVRFQQVDFVTSSWSVIRLSGDTITYLRSLNLSGRMPTGDSTALIDAVRIQVYNADQPDWESPSSADLVYDSSVDAYPFAETDTPKDCRIAGLGVADLFVKIFLYRTQNTTPVIRGIRTTYS